MIVYTDDSTKYNEDEIRQEMAETWGSNPEDFTEKEVQNFIETDIHFVWEDLWFFLDPNQKVLCLADLGLWDGRQAGGKVGTLKTIVIDAMEDFNTLSFNEEENTLQLEAIHHDGTNDFTFYGLTDEGWEYAAEHGRNKACHDELLAHPEKYLTKIIYKN